jgi:NAD(P)-dependent dehydrogenase (short-subunit alcohol dehydrogenase family)
MAAVWCIVSDDEGEATGLAGLLLGQGHQVAVIAADVRPFAALVNRYADAVLTAEIRTPDPATLDIAMSVIEENFGAVDVLALVAGDGHPCRSSVSRELFATRWPEAEVLVVSPAEGSPARLS